jgi:hypothetical protein
VVKWVWIAWHGVVRSWFGVHDTSVRLRWRVLTCAWGGGYEFIALFGSGFEQKDGSGGLIFMIDFRKLV